MSGRSSPVNGGYEAANVEPAMRLTVRKDLFPEVGLPMLASGLADGKAKRDDLGDISCVKLETDFEQSIDDIANQKLQVANGSVPSPERHRHRKHKQHSRRDSRSATLNGLSSDSKRRKSSPRHSQPHRTMVPSRVKGGKNLNLVSSSECRDEEDEVEEESSEDEVLKCSVKLPLISVPRQSGKPYSHELSQLSSKKSKSKNSSKERRSRAIIPCSGKPRAMLDICSSHSKKKSKKSENAPTYRSQIVDTNTIKIKIRRTSIHNVVTPRSVADIGQRKSKKKKASSPVPSESSGEEYDPSRGDTAASMSVAAPKPRHPPAKTRRPNVTKKDPKEKADNSRRTDTGPQSPWGLTIPEEILVKIFDNVVSTQGTLPSVIRLSRVCKLWHSVSCRSELWQNVDLANYTVDKCKTDYKLAWLLENRLSKCHTLNLAHWKVCNVPWVVACLAEYSPALTELSVAGWSRLAPEHLHDLLQSLPLLKRIDLSLTSEMGGSGTCLSAASMAHVSEHFGTRLTHLTLANNKFTALQQVLTSIAAHCPNLEVLDVSGARATSHPAAVPLEALQKGCPKVRVFRAANAQLVLATATASQQTDGWSQLEELSIAGEAAAERVAVGEYRLDDDALSRLVRGSTRLRLLDLRGLQRLTDSGLVRVPAWDLQHLFLGGCNVSRQTNSCLELICEKWSHSLIELDLSWATAARPLDAGVFALAEAPHSKLRTLNLCGSSVSLDPVKKVLLKCSQLDSLNLSSCRALPRGMKRHYTGKELQDLKDSLDPEKCKAKEEAEKAAKKKKDVKKQEADSKSEIVPETSLKNESESAIDSELQGKSSPEQKSTTLKSSSKTSSESDSNKLLSQDKTTHDRELELSSKQETSATDTKTPKDSTPTLASPNVPKPDSSSTPRSDSSKLDMGSPHFSPVPKPDSQIPNSPQVSPKCGSWNLGQFKTTPTHKSEASPLNRSEGQSKTKQCKVIEQCSPTTSQDNKLSPEAIQNIKQDMKNPNTWNYGNYSPMPRQENQFSTQRSPYSTQPSPAQPSPYSAQPSPYSAQPSPYSSQPSPYSAQPSPDTSQIVKPDLQKSGNNWNTGNFSPMTKHPAPFSPHPSTHTSPDPGLGVKSDSSRSNPNKTSGQYSPMSRQDRHHHSPYSPRPSMESVAYTNKKSPGMASHSYSPLMRADCHLPSPDGGQTQRGIVPSRQELYNRPTSKAQEMLPIATTPTNELPSWGMERFGQLSSAPTLTPNLDPSLVWSAPPFSTEQALASHAVLDSIPGMLNTPPAQSWPGMSPFDGAVRRRNNDNSDPWTLGQFRVEPPHQVHNNFVEQNISFDALSAHLGQQHMPPGYLDDSYSEPSRAD